MNQIGWKHSIDETGSFDGSSDAGIATFAGDPVTNFAREGVQNSLDAANKLDDGSKDKVIVELNINNVDKNSIPNVKELESNIQTAYRCFNEWFPDGDKKTVKFYKKLLNTLSKSEILVFQFKDSNTCGMDYVSNVKDNRLYKFLKGKGISGKDAGSGGSFGIGKTASFAVSDLRTVFVSTAFNDCKNNINRLTQGKCQITSFEGGDGHRSGTGYWGLLEGCEPINTDSSIPKWMQFQSKNYDTGTMLSIVGFNNEYLDLWEEKMSLVIAANYFAPIMKGKLEVIIGEKYILNNKSLQEILKHELYIKKIEKIGFLGNTHASQVLNHTEDYLSTYLDENDVITYEEVVSGVGKCSLKVRVSEGLSNKICFLRDGIKITDELRAQGITRLVGFKDFVAVFECLDQNGNELLRSTENPSHNNFEPSRIESATGRFKAEKAIAAIGSWIREKLKDSCREEASKVRDIEALMEFFSFEGEDDKSEEEQKNNSEEINPFSPNEGVEFPVEPIKPVDPKPRPGPDEPVPIPTPPNPNPEPDPNPNPEPDPKPVPTPVKRSVEILNPRQVALNSHKIRLIFSARVDSEINLSFYASGEDIDERVFPNRINGEKFTKKFKVKASSEKRNKIELEFNKETNYTLILKAYEIS